MDEHDDIDTGPKEYSTNSERQEFVELRCRNRVFETELRNLNDVGVNSTGQRDTLNVRIGSGRWRSSLGLVWRRVTVSMSGKCLWGALR